MNDSQAIRTPSRLDSGSDGAGPTLAPPAPTGIPLGPPPTLVFDEVVAELRRFVWGIVRDSTQVDDVLQATYLKAVEKGDAAHPETAKGWLFRVAYREALVVKRREATRSRTLLKLASLPTRDLPRPDAKLIQAETVAAVRQALQSLSEPQRRVVLARMHGDQTFAEIAAAAGMPLGTVLTHMRRALDKLRRVLDPGD